MSCVQDTPSISLSTVAGILSALLKISADAGNVAAVHADGLYVGSHVDIGDVVWSGRAAKSANFLLANGAAVSRSTYALLFAQYGTTYGPGDGSTTFNLPDIQGRTVVGVGTHADVSALGLNEGIGTVASRRPRHRTSLVDPGHVHGGIPAPSSTDNGGASPGNVGGTQDSSSATTGITVGTGVGTDPLDTSPYLTLNPFIRAL